KFTRFDYSFRESNLFCIFTLFISSLDNEPKLFVPDPRQLLYECLRWHLYILLILDILHLLHLFHILLLFSFFINRFLIIFMYIIFLSLIFDDLVLIHPRPLHIDHFSLQFFYFLL